MQPPLHCGNGLCQRKGQGILNSFLLLLQPSERMKIVDVIGEKTYQDGERIIAQVYKCSSPTLLNILDLEDS